MSYDKLEELIAKAEKNEISIEDVAVVLESIIDVESQTMSILHSDEWKC